MRRTSAFAVLASAVVVAVPTFMPSADAQAPADPRRDGLNPHPPIVVIGDAGPTGFVLADDPSTGDPVYDIAGAAP